MTDTRWVRKILWTAGGVIVLSLAVPFVVTLNFWQRGIAAALSQELGRPVRVGEIRLKLLGSPGFEIENVVVGEDPQFGIEPFARMESLRAGVALRSLWHRQLEFSTLVFTRPSLNVVRNADGQWNLETLWAPRLRPSTSLRTSSGQARSGISLRKHGPPSPAGAGYLRRLPPIEVESGRINFKSEAQKNIYVIDELDLDLISPSSARQPWQLRFEGTPSRTDSPLRPVSRIRGKAEFGPFSSDIQEETGTPVRLDLSTENGLLGDLLRTFAGDDYGVHAFLNFQLHLAGTTSLLRLSGKTSLADLHRWDLLPPAATSALRGEITGFVDLGAESFELTSFAIPLPEGSVVVQGRVSRLFHRPRAELQAQLREVSLATLVEIAKSFTNRVDSRFLGRGILNGRLEMAGSLGTLTGSLNVTDGVLQEKGTPHILRLSDFPIGLEGKTGSLGPVSVGTGKGGELRASLRWDLGKRASTIHLEGEAVPMVPLLEWARVFSDRAKEVPLSQGNLAVQADISTAAGKPLQIRGWGRISDAVLTSAAVNTPLRIPSARLLFQRDQILVKPFSATWGAINLRGSILAKPFLPATSGSPVAQARRIEFDCQVSQLDLADFERLWSPRSWLPSFLRLRNSAESAPTFFSTLSARGNLQADSVAYRGVAIKNVKTSLELRDRVVELRKFSGEIAGGTQTGKATIRFGPDPPSFSFETQFSGVELDELAKPFAPGNGSFSGKLSGEIRLAGSGRNQKEILEYLGGSGVVHGHNLALSGLDQAAQSGSDAYPIHRISSLSAAFQFAKKEVVLTDLKIVPAQPQVRGEENTDEAHAWAVTGTVGFDQKLDLQAREPSRGRYYRWTGSLAEPRVTEIPPGQEHPMNASVARK